MFRNLNAKEIKFYKQINIKLEKIQQKYLWYTMGVNIRALLIGLYGDSGRFPITFEVLINSINISTGH